jgi:hypothetical protein
MGSASPQEKPWRKRVDRPKEISRLHAAEGFHACQRDWFRHRCFVRRRAFAVAGGSP